MSRGSGQTSIECDRNLVKSQIHITQIVASILLQTRASNYGIIDEVRLSSLIREDFTWRRLNSCKLRILMEYSVVIGGVFAG